MAKIKIRNVLFNILAIVTVIAVAVIAVCVFTGTKGYAVTSDSMADKYVRGDAVFSKPVDFDDLKIGDIVTVKVGNSGYFTHRIVDIDKNARTVTTKGDANTSDDPMPSDEKSIVGRVWFSIPFIGYLSIVFMGKSSVYLLIVLVLIAAGFIAANTILQKRKQEVTANE